MTGPRRALVASLAAAISAAGCTPEMVRLEVPRVDGARTLLFVSALWKSEYVQLSIADLTEPSVTPLGVVAPDMDGAELTALYYLELPQTLGLEPGPLARAEAGEANRGLPTPFFAGYGTGPILDGARPAWAPLEDLPSELTSIRIPTVPDHCLENGGCLVPVERQLPECRIPCPEPDFPLPPTEPQPPAAIALPVSTPCPSGWRTITSTTIPGLEVCEPWPDGGRPVCGPYQLALPGASSCIDVGSACPGNGWAPDLPGAGANIVYVRAGASGGNGSTALPFGRISDALAATSAVPGSIIALTAGAYLEQVDLDVPVTVWGACASGTVLRDPMSSGATIDVATSSVVVRNLTIEAAQHALRSTVVGASTRVVDVVISGASNEAILVENGATLDLENVLLRDNESDNIFVHNGASLIARRLTVDGGGIAIKCWTAGNEVDVRGAALLRGRGPALNIIGDNAAFFAEVVIEERTTAGAVFYGPDAEVTLDDLVVRDTGPSRAGADDGSGIMVKTGARVDGQRWRVERNLGTGVGIYDEGTDVTVFDLVVRKTMGRASDRRTGYGVHVQNKAGFRGTRLVLQDSHTRALYLELSATATISDVGVFDTRGQERDGRYGNGIVASGGAQGRIARAEIKRYGEVGVRVLGQTTQLTLLDADLDEQWHLNGHGFSIVDNASFTVSRAHIRNSRGPALYADGVSTRCEIEDYRVTVVIGNTPKHAVGEGIQATNGAFVRADRVAIDRAIQHGVAVIGEGTYFDVRDLEVGHTRSNDDGTEGGGLWIIGGARVDLSRGFFPGNRSAAVAVYEQGSRLVANNILARDTINVACTETMCSPDIQYIAGGLGLDVFGGSTADVETFVLGNNTRAGLRLGNESQVDLRVGSIFGSNIGADIRIKGYDLRRISDRVLIRDNAIRLLLDE